MSRRITRVHVQKLALLYHGKVRGQRLCGMSEGLCRVCNPSGQWWWALAHVSWDQIALSWSSDSWNYDNLWFTPYFPTKSQCWINHPKKNVSKLNVGSFDLCLSGMLAVASISHPEHFWWSRCWRPKILKDLSGISVPLLNCFWTNAIIYHHQKIIEWFVNYYTGCFAPWGYCCGLACGLPRDAIKTTWFRWKKGEWVISKRVWSFPWTYMYVLVFWYYLKNHEKDSVAYQGLCFTYLSQELPKWTRSSSNNFKRLTAAVSFATTDAQAKLLLL